jgi:hypothetical protein
MLWSFQPGPNFLEFRRMISTWLAEFGNYHPQVVVRELAEIFPTLICDIDIVTTAFNFAFV